MGQTFIWAATVALIAGLVVLRVDRYMNLRLRAKIRSEEVTLIERRTAARIADETADRTVALRNAELAKQTAEANAATALVSELRNNRLTAERAIIAAHVEAQQKLAVELVRADHEHARQPQDSLPLWERYLAPTGAQLQGMELILRSTPLALPIRRGRGIVLKLERTTMATGNSLSTERCSLPIRHLFLQPLRRQFQPLRLKPTTPRLNP